MHFTFECKSWQLVENWAKMNIFLWKEENLFLLNVHSKSRCVSKKNQSNINYCQTRSLVGGSSGLLNS